MGGLLAQLQQGPANLRKVEQPPPRPPAGAGAGAGGPSSDLMSAIAGGASRLKKVDANQRPENRAPAAPSLEGGGVASILARRIAIVGEQGSDTESSGGSEWDDDGD